MMAQRLRGGRLHLQHGPIDVILRAWGEPCEVVAAERAVAKRFATILEELVAELPALRSAVDHAGDVQGLVARRMVAACRPFARTGVFVTAMAAVAGAVADELLETMRGAAPRLRKAFVNDGGDIAVHLAPGEILSLGMVARPDAAATPFDGRVTIGGSDQVGGVATSGRHGRSFSLGIADAVTVLAGDAATADAAATLIANAVSLDSPSVQRAAASSLDPDSDLGERLVTVAVGPLTATEVALALDAGAERAGAWARAGLIRAAALRLQGQVRTVGAPLLQEQAA